MSQNIGTLITAAIRPNDSLDLIASAFANEIKGGHHGTASLAERNSIIVERREWGMLATVYNDGVPSNNKTYQLSYGYVDTNLSNNANWIEFAGGGGGGGSVEWVDSVFSRLGVEPGSPTIGDRYLITSPSGTWATYPDHIAEYISSGTWSYTVPRNGLSVRVDNQDDSVFRYEGTYPTGTWIKELVNQVRFVSALGTNGSTYSASPNPTFSYTTEMLYLTTFGITNSASASLSINGMGYVPIKKTGTTGLVDVVSGDLVPGVVYHFTYDGSRFQVSLPSSGSSFGVPSRQIVFGNLTSTGLTSSALLTFTSSVGNVHMTIGSGATKIELNSSGKYITLGKATPSPTNHSIAGDTDNTAINAVSTGVIEFQFDGGAYITSIFTTQSVSYYVPVDMGGSQINNLADGTSTFDAVNYGQLLSMAGSTTSWVANGNTFSSLSFIGTLNAFDFPIRTNNIEVARFTSAGRVGIGTATPSTKFHISGTAGSIRIVDGTQVSGYVLTSDSTGVGTWRPPGSPPGIQNQVTYWGPLGLTGDAGFTKEDVQLLGLNPTIRSQNGSSTPILNLIGDGTDNPENSAVLFWSSAVDNPFQWIYDGGVQYMTIGKNGIARITDNGLVSFSTNASGPDTGAVLTIQPTTDLLAQLNLMPGTGSVVTPGDGDIFYNNDSTLKMKIGSDLRTFAFLEAGQTFSDAISMGFNKILNVASGSNPLDAVNYGQLLAVSSGATGPTGPAGAGTFTASNGLTSSAGIIELGGVLTKNTNITGTNSFSLGLGTLSNKLFNLSSYSSNNVNILSLTGSGPTIINSNISLNNTGSTLAYVNANTNVIGSTIIDSTGHLSQFNDGGTNFSEVRITPTSSIIKVYDFNADENSLQILYDPIDVSDTSIDNRFIVTDFFGLKGLVYAGDYTANFTDNSLITKGYMDMFIAGLSGGGIVYAGSGLTESGPTASKTLSVSVDNGISIVNDYVVLGGTLSYGTQIINDMNPFTMSSNSTIELNSIDIVGGYNFKFNSDPTSIKMEVEDYINGFASNLKLYSSAQTVSDGSSDNRMIVADGFGAKGLVYADDYTGSFTNNSLVTKGYVDSVTTTITAYNGLTAIGGVITLGGFLNQNTIIGGDQFSFQLGDYGTEVVGFRVYATQSGNINLFVGSVADGTYSVIRNDISSGPGLVYQRGGAGGGNTIFTDVNYSSLGSIGLVGSQSAIYTSIEGHGISNNGFTNHLFVYDEIGLKGLVYEADYSANFTPESLVSKRYVDNLVAASASYTMTISDKNLVALDTTGDGQFSGATISNTPVNGSYVAVFINGQEFLVGNGVTSSVDCYFSNDGGSTSRLFSQIVANDRLYWNGSYSGVNLLSGWRISLHYLV